MSSVKLVNITKSFDEKIVLQDINIDIKDGELVSLLGVSGCGKSTTLQLIAGLINPDSGDIIKYTNRKKRCSNIISRLLIISTYECI